MVDDKDKIIVIEEESKSQEQDESSSEAPETPSLVQQPKKNKKKLFFVVVLASFLLVLSVLAFIFFHFKTQIPKKAAQLKPVKVIKTKEKLDLHFIDGLNLENKGNLEDAIKEFKKSKGYVFLAYLNISKIYQIQNKEKMAYEYIQKAQTYLDSTLKDPNEYIDSYMYLFSYYMQNNHFNEADSLLKTLQSSNIKKHELNIMKVYYNFITQRNTKATLAHIDQLLKEGFRDKLLYEMLGYIYASEKNYGKALYYLSKVNNSNFGVERNMAFLEFANNNLESALNFAINSLNKKQNSQLTYFAYLLALKNNQISTAYNLISNLDSNNAINDFNIVPILNNKELLKQVNFKDYGISYALESLLIIQLIEPIHYSINLSSNVLSGDVYLSFGLLNQAKESYLTAINTSASLDLANKAYFYFKNNDLAQSLVYYEKASEKNPSNPILYYDLALLYEKNYNFDKAKQMFNVLINRYPNFPLPYFNMALISFSEGSIQKAKDSLNQFLSKQSHISNKPKSILVCNAYSDSLLGKLKEPGNINLQDFVLLKAISNNDFSYLKLEKDYLNNKLHINMDNGSMENIIQILSRFNPNLNRLLSDLYLINNKPDKALKIFANLNDYDAQDYYKMALCYLLLGYKNQADIYLTKSMLLSKNSKGSSANPLFAKLVIQIMNNNLKGMQDITKKVDSNRGLLSFDIEVKK
ncbi:MAG: tetratricopeptide repeat protein [Desulfurella sp.]|uniref:tetratricopeptide repeat protein n=1 Tax=Desulfurella sp. TaxID=1962857 RepID=UPI003C8A910B